MYEDRRDPDLSPQKRRVTGQAVQSRKVECPAKMVIKIKAPLVTAVVTDNSSSSLVDVQAEERGQNRSAPGPLTDFLGGPPREDSEVTVTYHWQHKNHTPGSLVDLARQRNCRPVRDWIEAKVNKGCSVEEIMKSVRLSLAELRRTLDSKVTTTTAPPHAHTNHDSVSQSTANYQYGRVYIKALVSQVTRSRPRSRAVTPNPHSRGRQVPRRASPQLRSYPSGPPPRTLNFLPETAHIRENATWQSAPSALTLTARRVDIAGPTG
ncbi:hypothetical protein A4X13_0g8072 [Tilletia indica]|uniref:Uncharacterized protein n=1 Tax=Tilletia indica TaxID=43049 RepID=A0A8T8SGE2_9BASI|nr:hypothetical protein A4X13_0g8072 [Tilletia indica]